MKKKQKRGTISTWASHLRRLLRKVFTHKEERSDIAEWLLLVEKIIGRHSGPKDKTGLTKGHSHTDVLAWIEDLAGIVAVDIERKNRGRVYDGNMAIAAKLGLILVSWYAHVHHAKSFDPNRPLNARRMAAAQRTRFLAELYAILADDSIMGEVWGRKQKWNFPFGRGAKGGRFV